MTPARELVQLAAARNGVDLDAVDRDAFLRAEVERLELRDEAARIVRQKRAGALLEPSPMLLGDFLAVQDEPERYRVERLWPVGGRVVLAAQYKAGKTTLRDNLVRALADDELFLGRFEVNPPEGRMVVIDDELDERMLRRWLRDQGVRNTDRVAVLPLRGRVGTFDLLDEDTRARWAAKLREVGASVVLFDCLRPVLDALGLSEDKDAGRFLVHFDALLSEAGAAEAVVVHHMGHQGERSRGDTRIRDWPDVEWRLVRQAAEDGQQEAGARRYFAAYGRDVEQPEGLLAYDPGSRRLTFEGGTRQDSAAEEVLPDVLAYLGDDPGASQRAVIAALHVHPRRHVITALEVGKQRGRIDTAEGAKRAILHFLATPESASAPSAPPVRQRTSDECASAPIGRTHTHTRSEQSVRHGALPEGTP